MQCAMEFWSFISVMYSSYSSVSHNLALCMFHYGLSHSNDVNLGLTLTYCMAQSNLVTLAFQCNQSLIFQKVLLARDIKNGRNRQFTLFAVYMKLCSYLNSCFLLTLP